MNYLAILRKEAAPFVWQTCLGTATVYPMRKRSEAVFIGNAKTTGLSVQFVETNGVLTVSVTGRFTRHSQCQRLIQEANQLWHSKLRSKVESARTVQVHVAYVKSYRYIDGRAVYGNYDWWKENQATVTALYQHFLDRLYQRFPELYFQRCQESELDITAEPL